MAGNFRRRGVATSILLIAAQLVGGNGCKSAKQIEAARQKAQAEKRIGELAKQYGATSDWMKRLGKDDSGAPLSFERQEVFERLIGRPLLLLVWVDDIRRAKDVYRLVCRVYNSGAGAADWQETYFVLDLPGEKARQVAATGSAVSKEVFAVVAIPNAVNVQYERGLFAEAPQSSDDDPSVSIGELTPELWVHGKCLDVECLPGWRH